MRKRIVNLTCLALLLAFVLCMTGCSGNEQEAFIGTWQCRINLADQLNEGLASDPEVAEYLSVDEFYLAMNIQFREDGTYVISVDETGTKESLDSYLEVMKEGMSRYMEALMKDQTGIEMTIDQILAAANLTMDDLLAQFSFDQMLEEMVAAANQEGKYQVKKGKLFTSESLDTDINPLVYERYELSGNTLVLLELVGSSDEGGMPYPMTFEKIS